MAYFVKTKGCHFFFSSYHLMTDISQHLIVCFKNSLHFYQDAVGLKSEHQVLLTKSDRQMWK